VTRSCFAAANLESVVATDTSLEFCDVRQARFVGTTLLRGSLVGCDTEGATFEDVDLREADLFWTSLDPSRISGGQTNHARWPEVPPPAFGPAGAAAPSIAARSLSVTATPRDQYEPLATRRPVDASDGTR
jgi:hypothetical protein